MPSRSLARRLLLTLEILEGRLVLNAPAALTVPLNPSLDQFGDQIAIVQAYQDSSRTAFSIFDTGASTITFSQADQSRFSANQSAIPIKAANALAEGIGGAVSGSVSQPGTILADGIHAANLSFDALNLPQFTMHFGSASAATPGVQALVGTSAGSAELPTITGTPILNPSANDPHGLAAEIDMQGATFDFSTLEAGLVLSMPDLHFVTPDTTLPQGVAGTTDPVRIPLVSYGADNHVNPGNAITESANTIQPDVTLSSATFTLAHQHFLFDTGAQMTIISTAEARALGLDLAHPDSSITVQGVGGNEQVPSFTLNQLVLPTGDGGTVTFTSVPVQVLDVGSGIDGILGMNLFNTAVEMLYNPFDAAGPSVSLTFSTSSDRGPGIPDSTHLAALQNLGVPLAGMVHGHALPEFSLLPGQITGSVFQDLHGNGIQDAGDPGLPGTTVFLDLAHDGHLDPGDPFTTTDAAGGFQFTGLTPGNYTVAEVLPPNLVPTTPYTFQAAVGNGATSIGTFGVTYPSTSPQTIYVVQLYATLLDRLPDAPGLASWVQGLQSGMVSYDQVIQGIWNSAEHYALEVNQLYQNLLHHPADAGGQAYWVHALQAGLSEGGVEQAILNSAEYQGMRPDPVSFVQALYGDVLQRGPSAAEVSYWQGQLQSGVSRALVIRVFVQSPEAYQLAVASSYALVLQRAPDAGGEQYWIAALESGRISLEGLYRTFLNSTEFWALAGRDSASANASTAASLTTH